MSNKKPVVIYGVTGYTGRLVAEYCREYNIPFVAAGRNGASIKDVLSKVPGIETASYDIVEVKEHTVASLRSLVKGAKVMLNMSARLPSSAPRPSRPASRKASTTRTPTASRTG